MNIFKSRTTAVVAGAAVLAFATGSVAVANQDARGPQGDQGPASAPGLQGLKGQDGVSGVEALEFYPVRTDPNASVGAGEKTTVYATCPDGKVAIGGGFAFEQATAGAVPVVYQSAPSTRAGDFVETENGVRSTAWEVIVQNNGTGTFNANPWVVCAFAD